MESGVIELSLLSRSLGPACSNVEFLFLGQRRRIYRAYGVPGGAILIQRLPVTKRDLSKESAITEIVIDGVRSTTTSRIDDVLRIAHNHGEACLMAATSQTDLSIISLLPFHEATTIDPKQTPVYKRLLSIPFPGVLAMEWTRNGEGLVLSDARGYITCLSISVHHKPPPSDTLTRRSLLYDMTGSIEILWVEEMKCPCEILCPGDTIESPCATAASSLSISVDLFSPSAPEMEKQRLTLAAPLTGMTWSRVRTPPAASMKPCLLTVESNGMLRIWVESPKAIASYLGCSQLQSTSDPVHSTAYHVELVIQPQDPDLVPHSMQACWVDAFPESEEDPRLAWIIATYQAKRAGGIEECCAVYVVHGLPVELQGTQITCSYATTFLHSSCTFDSICLPATTLRAVLLRFEPTPQILMAESGRLANRIETRTALLCVDTLPPDSIHLHLESTSIHEIVGFASIVQQLVAHPVHDCVCVLTEDRIVGIWDLWPVRKLADIQADDFGIGNGVYALTWMDLGHHYGELGHILLLGDRGAVVCLLMADHHNGKPVISIDVLASHTYPQLLYPVSLIALPCLPSPGIHKMPFLIRARSADVEIDDDDEASVYVTLSVNQMDSDTHDVILEQSAAFHLFRSSEGCRYTVMDAIRHSVGGVVAGTRGGTLEFFKCSKEKNIPEHVSSFALSSENDRPSFISCLSSCTQAAYIACVTSFDEHQNEDKIHIVQSESTCGQLDYRLEDRFVSPSGIVSQISWVQTPSPFPQLVVGYQAGQVDIFVRKRHGLWVPVGTYISSLEVTTLTTTKQGLPIVGAGCHILFLSSDAHTFSADVLDDTAVMQMALTVGGAFQDYHHIPLLTLLQIGHLCPMDTALNEMSEFLKEWEGMPEDEHLEEIFATTINGPPSLLNQTFAEPIVPPVQGLHFGDETLFCVPFKESTPHVSSTDAAQDAPSVLPATDPSITENSGLLTGQFDFSQFNNFSKAPPQPTPPTYEASGLLDMSAFGMSFEIPSPSPEVPKTFQIQEASTLSEEMTVTKPLSEENDEPSKEGDESGADVLEEEECILFTLDANFDEHCRKMLQLKEPLDSGYDQDYICRVLKQYVNSTDPNYSLPLGSLLKLSKNNANLLLDLINKYNAWSRDMSKTMLDVPGMKFLAAVKLSPLSTKCQPKRTESKNLRSELSKKEDYLASFLGISFYQSVISEASVATSVSDSSVIDDRLAEGYVSWPESVGIVSGIEAVHILWALETCDASHLLSVCLEATAEAGSQNGQLSGYTWERLKSIGAGFWIRDQEAAIRVADQIAKEQFRKNNNPHDCALMYIALKKKALLSRLFRSNGNARVATLLAKDFSQNHNQRAAAKNAYVLLGQHRYSLAAAFFLVGGYIHDAIGVCAKEMRDPQLALFLTTLLQTRDERLVHEIIMKEVFPHAVATDDRVAQGMLLWLMDQKMEALKAITTVKALKSELSIHDRTVSKILLLQFVFWRGLMQLDGRFVPLWMFDQIKSVAAHCAHVLEACGMPSLALRALMVSQDLESQMPNPRDTSLYQAWSTRLATAMMMTHLPSPHAVNARDPAMILWHQHVQQDVATLSDFGVEVDGDIVFEHMQYVMDCLYDVPSAPVFPKQTTQPPDLSEPNGRLTAPSPIPAYLRMPLSTTKNIDEEGSADEIASLQSNDLLHVDGDRCVGVCFSRNEGFFGVRNPTTKRVAVATGKHGIHYIDWDPVEDPQSMAAYHALYEKFEKERWPSLSWLRDTTALDHQGNAISTKEILSGPLKSHPSSSFFLSGCGEESILLWQYGMGTPCARFALESSTGTGFETMHRLSWSATGGRVAAVGYGGMCALWDVTSAYHNHTIGRTDWSYKIAPKKGYDVEFVMGSGSVIATTGEDDVGRGVVSLWDTLAPRASCRISHLEYRHAVTELTTIPDTLLFISAQDSGTIQAHDFRMLGGVAPKALWSINSIHDGPITSLEVGWAPVASPRVWELFLATGGRDGDVCLINGIQESGHLRQRLKRAHWKKTGQLAHLLISGLRGNLGNVSLPPFGVQRTHPESASGVPVLDIDWCDEGLLTAGADGFVQLFPFSS